MLSEKDDYCLYCMLKIYHFIKIFHNIEIRDFIGEFVEDSAGNIFLFNTVVIDIKILEKKKIVLQVPLPPKEVLLKAETSQELLDSPTENSVVKKPSHPRPEPTDSSRVLRILRTKKSKKLREFASMFSELSTQKATNRISDLNFVKAVESKNLELKSFMDGVKKMEKIAQSNGTSSFLAPDRKKAMITQPHMKWLSIDVSNGSEMHDLISKSKSPRRVPKSLEILKRRIDVDCETKDMRISPSYSFSFRNKTLPPKSALGASQIHFNKLWTWRPSGMEHNDKIYGQSQNKWNRKSRANSTRSKTAKLKNGLPEILFHRFKR